MPEISHHWPSEGDLARVCGSRIKTLREQRSLSQRQLAEQLQISKTMITKYELGLHTPPAHVLVRLAKVLRVTVDSLLGYAAQTPRLASCLQAIDQMDDESSRLIVQTLDSIVTTYRELLARHPKGHSEATLPQ